MYLLLNFFVIIEQKLQYYDEQMQHGQVLKMEIISFSNLKIFKFNKKILQNTVTSGYIMPTFFH